LMCSGMPYVRFNEIFSKEKKHGGRVGMGHALIRRWLAGRSLAVL
jgi:hypothetical protein